MVLLVEMCLQLITTYSPLNLADLYTFAILESAPVGTTVGRVMAEDADFGINARMNYTLDDLEESATFRIQTDPTTEEGIVILARVSTIYLII